MVPAIEPVAVCAKVDAGKAELRRRANRNVRRTSEQVIPAASASERTTGGGRSEGWESSSTHSLSTQKVDRRNPWVGLLARKERITRCDRWPLHLPRPTGRVALRSGGP